ncbi:MAG: hypothetical protein ABSA32_09170 [Candidatus Acidiferrales bacterium]|jgi:hypothetical protein
MRKYCASVGILLSTLILTQFTPVAAAQSVDLSVGATFTFDIGPNLPQFTFKVIPEPQPKDSYGDAQSTVREIQVFQGKSGQPLQRLTGCDLNDMAPPPDGSDWFHTEDINFDGYQDLYLMTTSGGGNQGGCVWLFNPKTRRFDYSEEFSELDGARLDPATKTIFSYHNGGMGGVVHDAEKH